MRCENLEALQQNRDFFIYLVFLNVYVRKGGGLILWTHFMNGNMLRIVNSSELEKYVNERQL